MNNGKRKLIRDKVKELLVAAAISDIELFTFKKAKLSGTVPAVCIYLEQGETDGIENTASLTIRVMAPDEADIDDLLDGVADQVQTVLASNLMVENTWRYITEGGFAYDRDEAEGWTALDLTYGVNY